MRAISQPDGAEAARPPLRVGTVKGPGDKPHEFVFITPDRDGATKNGEFVYYTLPGEQRRVIARITGRRTVRGYPDDFLADPDVPPDLVARVAGFEADECELLEVCAAVIGYYDAALKTLVNPRIPPRVGWPIYLAPPEMLVTVLNKKQRGELGSCYLGWLLSRGPEEVPVVLSAREFTSTHLAIIAGTGAGKSYTAGVIVEELLRPANKACVLVLDPHGEYGTLDTLQNLPEFRDGVYQARVKCLLPDDLKVRFSALKLNDIRYLLGDVPERQDWLLGRAYNALVRETRDAVGSAERWTVKDLVAKIESLAHGSDESGLDLRSSAGALEWRLDRLTSESRIFSEVDHIRLAELLEPGQCTVLQLHDLTQREQQVIAAVLLRRLYEARNQTLHKKTHPGDDLHLPYPVFCLLEEAHTFAPGGDAGGRVVSSQVLKQILGEGRKFGIGIGLISQRPGKLDQDVLSQAMTQVIMRIVNPLDQQAVAAAVESASREVLDELPSLSKGHAIVLGASLNAPALIQVRPRLTTHGGEDLDAPREWNAYFSEEALVRRNQERAGLVHRSGIGVGITRREEWSEADERPYAELFGAPQPPDPADGA